jgi:hypothetical protein
MNKNLFFDSFFEGLLPCEVLSKVAACPGWPLGKYKVKILKGKGSIRKGEVLEVDSRNVKVKTPKGLEIFLDLS